MRIKIISMLICFCIPFFAFPEDYIFNAAGLENPRINNGWVTVQGNYLSLQEISRINQKIDAINAATGVEIAVVVVPHTNGVIKRAAQDIFDLWKIGNRELNNGILLLASMEERQFRTHTGYGMEKILTDDHCLALQEDVIVPSFKQGKYGDGIYNYLVEIEKIVNPGTDSALPQNEVTFEISPEKDHTGEVIVNYYFFPGLPLVLFILGLLSLFFGYKKTGENLQKRYDTYSKIQDLISTGLTSYYVLLCLLLAAASFIISVYAFKTFVFLQGLQVLSLIFSFLSVISGIGCFVLFFWALKKQKEIVTRWRTEPRSCPDCNGTMEKLGELEDDAFLHKHQQVEERIRTMDYDVWLCGSCDNKTIESFRGTKAWLYKTCTSCGSLASKKAETIIMVHATYTHSGKKKIVFRCMACGFEIIKYVTIPKKVKSQSSSFSSFSSSSSSGFGGGSSGGGGATSSW